MKVKPTWAAATVTAAAALAFSGAPLAGADTDVKHLGQPGELVNGVVVQHWTITGLKPSTDAIPYRPAGTLWEATATDEAVSGSVTPIISNLNARAKNGQTYRVLFGVATEQGVNPAPITQGQKTTGKIYFDVTGEQPDSVVYNDGAADLIVWVQPPPPPPTRATGSAPARTGTSPSVAAPAEDAAPAESATPAEPAAVPATPAPEALPAGSSGTPLPEGSSGTPLPEGAASVAEPGPAPIPAAATPAPAGSAGTPAPAGSAGTPVPHGSSGTPLPDAAVPAAEPAPGGSAPVTTVVPAPPA